MKEKLEFKNKIKIEIEYFMCSNHIFDSNFGLTAIEKIVYMYLVRCGHNNEYAYPSYQKIANCCSISRRTAVNAVNRLIELKIIYKHLRPNKKNENDTNIYEVLTKLNEFNLPSAGDALPPSAGDALPSAGDALPPSAGDALPSAGDAPKKELNKNNYIYKELNKNIELKNSVKSKDLTQKIDYQNIINSFNNYCDKLAKVQTLTEKRKTLIKKIIKDNPDFNFDNYFKNINNNNFLTGNNNRGWKANFDWILKTDNKIKIEEGNYNYTTTTTTTTSTTFNANNNKKQSFAEIMKELYDEAKEKEKNGEVVVISELKESDLF